MTDITQLILDDHDTIRREFSALDDAEGLEQLRTIWESLTALLELHTAAEEAIFYPNLLRRGDIAENETAHAIGDHNDIHSGVRAATRFPVGDLLWWDGVRRAQMANSEHMMEEEDETIAEFRRNASPRLRDELGRRFLEFKTSHGDARDLDTGDRDPMEYLSEVGFR